MHYNSIVTALRLLQQSIFKTAVRLVNFFYLTQDCILLAIEKLRQHPLNLGCHAGAVLPDC